MIALPDDGPDGDAWRIVCELSKSFTGRWCLIGARMVELHGRHAGFQTPRASADIDALCDARAMGSRPRELAGWLRDRGFDLDGVSPEGVGHRFRRDTVSVDVLAPDHLGPRADLDVGQGARTLTVPGGRRVLNHAMTLAVRCGDMRADVPVPTLAGALLAKSEAVGVDDTPRNQRIDLAFLYSLVEDPRPVSDELGQAGLAVLARRTEMDDPGHEAWFALGERATRAYDAYRFLIRG